MAARDIFISYRRGLSAGYAGHLHNSLELRLGRGRVFVDETDIGPGEAFPAALKRAVSGCRAVIVLIAPGWAEVTDARGLRLHQPDDWVRIEIEAALAGKARVVPVLVGEARMPRADQLPPTLRPLAERQAIDLRNASWDDDLRRLVAALGVARSPSRWLRDTLQRLQATPRVAAALLVGVVVSLVVWLTVTGLAGGIGAPPGAAGDGRSISASVYDMRLTTLTPTQAEQDALARRFAIYGLNVPLLRRFFAFAARDPALEPQALDPALVSFAETLRRINNANFYDDTGNTHLGSNHPSEAGQRLVMLGQFDEAQAAFTSCSAPAASAAGTGKKARRTTAADIQAQHVERAWCQWLLGKLQSLQRFPDAADQSFMRADADLQAAGGAGARLRVTVAEDRAHLALAQDKPAAAITALDAAVTIARESDQQYRLKSMLLELAALLEQQGRMPDALQRREEALRVAEADARSLPSAGSPEHDNAIWLVRAYDQAGRKSEAAALRDRYGLGQ